MCVLKKKNDYTVKLRPELRWTGTPFYYYYYFLFLFWWLLPESLFVLIDRWNEISTVYWEKEREESEHFTWFVEKLFELLTRILFWKTLKRDGCKDRSKERAYGKHTGGKASTYKPIVLTMKAKSNVLYSPLLLLLLVMPHSLFFPLSVLCTFPREP